MVKASLTGSVIGNLLLVLGLSIFAGGLKFKVQSFNVSLAGMNGSLMLVAVIALIKYLADVTDEEDEELPHEREPEWSKGKSILYLLLATVMVAFVSEWLVDTLETFTTRFGLSELFVGAFLVAIIGNAAEHSAAVMLAMKNKIGAAVEIAVGSSLQIALFVAPVLVLVSYFFGPTTMDLVFTTIELLAIGVSVFIAKSIIQDGKTNWYEACLRQADDLGFPVVQGFIEVGQILLQLTDQLFASKFGHKTGTYGKINLT
ncbi:hypothetical protein BGX30_000323 [Mortierella sp. GBA39]|nr:hypothetical protein BGX30_000323 [Mortierella sp. GBA39]